MLIGTMRKDGYERVLLEIVRRGSSQVSFGFVCQGIFCFVVQFLHPTHADLHLQGLRSFRQCRDVDRRSPDCVVFGIRAFLPLPPSSSSSISRASRWGARDRERGTAGERLPDSEGRVLTMTPRYAETGASKICSGGSRWCCALRSS